MSERQRHEKLEFPYEANRTLSRSPEVAEALEGLLARSLETFRAESAEVILFQRDGVPLRTTLGPAASAVMQPMDPATAAALAALVNDEQPVVSLIQPFGSERLDDFGTGYSSLSYLHSLPLDILNVAKPFVDGLTGGGRESRFVGMILDLARALGLEVIAEGIESAEQVDALRELRTEFGQGYYLARPSAAADTSLVTALAG